MDIQIILMKPNPRLMQRSEEQSYRRSKLESFKNTAKLPLKKNKRKQIKISKKGNDIVFCACSKITVDDQKPTIKEGKNDTTPNTTKDEFVFAVPALPKRRKIPSTTKPTKPTNIEEVLLYKEEIAQKALDKL